MTDNTKLKRWETALALSLCVTFCHALLFDGVGLAWWGVIFPGLTGDAAAVETSSLGAEGVELRFQLLDWLRGLFH